MNNNNYISVTTTIKVPRICSNCLYFGANGYICGNANNHGKAMLLANLNNSCTCFWLDQNKYPIAESRW